MEIRVLVSYTWFNEIGTPLTRENWLTASAFFAMKTQTKNKISLRVTRKEVLLNFATINVFFKCILKKLYLVKNLKNVLWLKIRWLKWNTLQHVACSFTNSKFLCRRGLLGPDNLEEIAGLLRELSPKFFSCLSCDHDQQIIWQNMPKFRPRRKRSHHTLFQAKTARKSHARVASI